MKGGQFFPDWPVFGFPSFATWLNCNDENGQEYRKCLLEYWQTLFDELKYNIKEDVIWLVCEIVKDECHLNNKLAVLIFPDAKDISFYE